MSVHMEDSAQVSMLERVSTTLFYEAHLLDSWDLDGWLALWAEELTYWVPVGEFNPDPSRHISLIYDNRPHLEDRLWKMKGSYAFAQEPPSRLARSISNIRIASDDGEVTTVLSTFVLVEHRRGVQHIHAGRYEHRLVAADDHLAIAYKKVELLGNNDYLDNLTILL